MPSFADDLLYLAKALPVRTVLHEENLVLSCLADDFTDGHSHGGTLDQLDQEVKELFRPMNKQELYRLIKEIVAKELEEANGIAAGGVVGTTGSALGVDTEPAKKLMWSGNEPLKESR